MSPPWAVVAFFAAWIPWNLVELRADRKTTLTAGDQVRIYAGALMDFSRKHPNPTAIVLSAKPESFQIWGIVAALNYPYPGPRKPPLIVAEDQVSKLAPETPVTFISWDRDRARVNFLSKVPGAPDAAYLKMGPETPFWQLDDGWYGLDDYFRWTAPQAAAHLSWPEGAGQFEVVVNVSPSIMRVNGYTEVRLNINGRDLGARRFDRPGIESIRWALPPRDAPEARIGFTVEPASHFPPDPRLLGAPVVAFGFVPGN
jgi:hypothetical protein